MEERIVDPTRVDWPAKIYYAASLELDNRIPPPPPVELSDK